MKLAGWISFFILLRKCCLGDGTYVLWIRPLTRIDFASVYPRLFFIQSWVISAGFSTRFLWHVQERCCRRRPWETLAQFYKVQAYFNNTRRRECCTVYHTTKLEGQFGKECESRRLWRIRHRESWLWDLNSFIRVLSLWISRGEWLVDRGSLWRAWLEALYVGGAFNRSDLAKVTTVRCLL